MLEDRFILFGEWLYARHSVHYRRLPHYFFEFDIYDKESEAFLSLERRLALLEGTGIAHGARAPHRGTATGSELAALIGPSRFDSQFENPLTGRTDDLMEGLYLRTEADGRRDRAGEVRAARVRREGQAERALAAPGDGAEPARGRSGHLVMTWDELRGIVAGRDPGLGRGPALVLGRWPTASRMRGGMPKGMSGPTRRWSAPNCRMLDEWPSLTPHERTVLLFTALFHDSAKPLTSQVDPDTGRITSPKHAVKGEHLARSVLRDLGCDLATREEIARLVRFHGRPAFLLEKPEPGHEVVSLSWLGQQQAALPVRPGRHPRPEDGRDGAARGEPASLEAGRRGERLLRSALPVRQRPRPVPVLPAGASRTCITCRTRTTAAR